MAKFCTRGAGIGHCNEDIRAVSIARAQRLSWDCHGFTLRLLRRSSGGDAHACQHVRPQRLVGRFDLDLALHGVFLNVALRNDAHDLAVKDAIRKRIDSNLGNEANSELSCILQRNIAANLQRSGVEDCDERVGIATDA